MKQQKINLTDILEKSDKLEQQSTSVVTAKADYRSEVPIPDTSSADKKRLPKIIVVTYNKNGVAEHKEYTCAEISIFENSKTILSGAKPTVRRDYLDISIEAKVVEV